MWVGRGSEGRCGLEGKGEVRRGKSEERCLDC